MSTEDCLRIEKVVSSKSISPEDAQKFLADFLSAGRDELENDEAFLAEEEVMARLRGVCHSLTPRTHKNAGLASMISNHHAVKGADEAAGHSQVSSQGEPGDSKQVRRSLKEELKAAKKEQKAAKKAAKKERKEKKRKRKETRAETTDAKKKKI